MEIYSLTETLSVFKAQGASVIRNGVPKLRGGGYERSLLQKYQITTDMSSGVHCVEAMSKYTVGLSLYLSLKLRSSVTDMVSTAWRLASLIT